MDEKRRTRAIVAFVSIPILVVVAIGCLIVVDMQRHRAVKEKVEDLGGSVTWSVRSFQSPLPRIETVTLPGRLCPERLEEIPPQRLIDARNRVLADTKALPGSPKIVLSYEYGGSREWTGSMFVYDYLLTNESL